MSYNESDDDAPLPARRVSIPPERRGKLSLTPSASRSRDSSRQRQGSTTSHAVFDRDILYRAINEFQLSGKRLAEYTDLLGRLGLNLKPHVSEGQHVWYRCHGRLEPSGQCPRMIPELYMRTVVGRILETAENLELQDDDLIEEISAGFAYAICSKHNQTVHKVLRAVDAQLVICEWRRRYRRSVVAKPPASRERSTTPPQLATPPQLSTPDASEEEEEEEESREKRPDSRKSRKKIAKFFG